MPYKLIARFPDLGKGVLSDTPYVLAQECGSY